MLIGGLGVQLAESLPNPVQLGTNAVTVGGDIPCGDQARGVGFGSVRVRVRVRNAITMGDKARRAI